MFAGDGAADATKSKRGGFLGLGPIKVSPLRGDEQEERAIRVV